MTKGHESKKHDTGSHGSGGPYSQHGATGSWVTQHGTIKADNPQPHKETPSDQKKNKDLPAAEVYHNYISKIPEEHHKKK